MKCRNGFVSNSSASSFLIYGTCVDRSELANIVKDSPLAAEALVKVNEQQVVYAARGDREPFLYETFADYFEDDISDAIDTLFDVALPGCENHRPFEDGSVYIGLSWANVEDDETGAQFKARVEAGLKRVFGEGLKCSTYEEAWSAY